jgi:hypothetical protein
VRVAQGEGSGDRGFGLRDTLGPFLSLKGRLCHCSFDLVSVLRI